MGKLILALWIMLLCGPVVSSACAEEAACVYCGMDRSKYEHSWMVIEYEGGSEGFCSVHCAAISMALHTDRAIARVTVGAFNSRQQIDADKASWVIGGDLPGVMTSRAKWAFSTPEEAGGFARKHGGRQASFREVLKATFEDMLNDTLLIRKKRRLIDLQSDHTADTRK